MIDKRRRDRRAPAGHLPNWVLGLMAAVAFVISSFAGRLV